MGEVQSSLRRKYTAYASGLEKQERVVRVVVSVWSLILVMQGAMIVRNTQPSDFFPSLSKHASWRAVVLPRLLTSAFMQPFFFVFGHLYLHVNMIQTFQCDYGVGAPLAFFHHYTDSRLYGLYPWSYRYGTAFVAVIYFCLVSFVCKSDQFLFICQFLILYCDTVVHEWYHTPMHKYKSWNIFSTKAIVLNKFMLSLEYFGMVDREAHKSEHHREIAFGMHDTEDWVDMSFPISGYIADKMGVFAWYVFKNYILAPLRGTFLPIHVTGVTLESVDRWRFATYVYIIIAWGVCLKASFLMLSLFNSIASWTIDWEVVDAVSWVLPHWSYEFRFTWIVAAMVLLPTITTSAVYK